MNNRQLLLRTYVVIGLALLIIFVHETEANGHKKKKITIHVPIHKKVEKHVHTIIKHIHHHHTPIPVVIKEEKIIKEEVHPIIQKEEHHHHHEHAVVEDVEEEHIHHHHNYEHKEGEGRR